jgi:hypothetical protein
MIVELQRGYVLLYVVGHRFLRFCPPNSLSYGEKLSELMNDSL